MISGGSGGPIRLKLVGSWLVVPVPVNEKKNFEAEKNKCKKIKYPTLFLSLIFCILNVNHSKIRALD